MAEAPVVLVMPKRPLAPQESFSIEDGVLVRRIGRRERRWPLNRLKSLTLGVRRSLYAPPVRFVRLTFVGRGLEVIAATPQTSDYGAFVRVLALAAAEQAPNARFHADGGRLAAVLVGAACLLGAGAAALAVSAVMAGLAPLAIELGARLVFLLIMIFALTPWIGRFAPQRLDPKILPAVLLDIR